MNDLLERFKSGDDSAGWELVLSQQNLLKGHIGKLKLSRTDPEDVLSDIQIILFNDLRLYDPEQSSISRFATIVFKNSIRRVLNRLSDKGSLPLPDICVQPDHEGDVERQELLTIATDILNKLSPLHRKILIMYCNDEMREEIAKAANKMLGHNAFTKNTIGKAINDTLSRVRGLLKEEIEELDS